MKKIEDLSLNAWPSRQMQVYDGWILRYSQFYTHRTNCVEQIGLSTLPLPEKIAYCEDIYRYWKTPCIFKITPIGDPGLDPLLAERGYGIEHATTVMTRSLITAPGEVALPGFCRIKIRGRTDSEWINGLFDLKGNISPVHRSIVPQMYDAIPKEEIAVSVSSKGKLIGTGLGILDRDTVGVYAIHVDGQHRRRGIASAIVRTILIKARGLGAENAYLQVVSDNTAARNLYRKEGFTDSYRYYFRVKYPEQHE